MANEKNLSASELERFQEKLGENIQRIRKEKGLTQQKLVEEAGIAQTSLAYIENGYNFAAFPTLIKIAKVLKVKVKDLIPF